MRTLAFFGVLGLVLAGCSNEPAPITDAQRTASIDQLGHALVERQGVPGVAIAVLRDRRFPG